MPISAEENDGDLRRPALAGAEQPHGDIVEELDHPGALQERAEQDEEEDVGGRDVGRDAVDALQPVGHVEHHLADRVAAVIERRRQVVAEEDVGEEAEADQRQRRPHHPPGDDEQDDEVHDADREIEDCRRVHAAEPGQDGRRVDGVQLVGPVHEFGVEGPVIETDQEADDAERPAKGEGGARMRAMVGDERRRDEDEEADVNGAQHLARQNGVDRRGDLEHREGDRDPEQHASLGARAPAVGQAVLDVHVRRGRMPARIDADDVFGCGHGGAVLPAQRFIA